MAYEPPYPKPLQPTDKRSLWNLFKRGKKSWLETLYEGAYKGKISRIRLPGTQIFLVRFPNLVREVLIDRYQNFPKHELIEEALKPLLGESIFTTNGPTWERQRRMLDPAFEQARLKEVFPMMHGASDDLLKRFDDLEDGTTTEIEVEMTHVTADIILRTILSVSLEGEGARKIFHSFKLYQEKATLMIQLGVFRIPLWLVPHHYFAWKRSGREIRARLEEVIKKRYELHQAGDPGDHKDILASLLEARDTETGTSFSQTELVDQVAMLFLAGHETSASALSWTLFLIAKCPDIQEQIFQETQAVIGDRPPEFRDISKLKVIRNVFRETMRLYPPVGFLTMRKADNVGCLHNREVPDGSPVVVSPWLMHRHRELWEEPDAFIPDRFEGGVDQDKCAYIPFGAGPRICIGAAFAMQEAMLILASLVSRFRFEAPAGQDPTPVSRLTIRSENGIPLQIFKR